MRKSAFCIFENKDADKLADQSLCFSQHGYYTIPFLPTPEISSLVGNPEDRFSRDEAHFISVVAPALSDQNRLCHV